MLSNILSSSTLGVDAYLVTIETDIARGLPATIVVGLPDTAVKEAKDRVRAAVKNSHFEYPTKRITINLAPADIKKEGPSLDLAIAIGILTAQEIVAATRARHYVFLGELALDGSVRPIRGILSIATFLEKYHPELSLIIPHHNRQEVYCIKHLPVFSVTTLAETVAFLRGEFALEPTKNDPAPPAPSSPYRDYDFSDIKGQQYAKRALEIAVAGGHNVLMIGPPGSGKTMLAKRIPTIMPPLTHEEAIETTKVHSIAGSRSPLSLISARPFRTPHHTASNIALIGGGTYPRPGEVSLAHNGVLFLDELPEFRRDVLEVLRQPLEDGHALIARAMKTLCFPARFMLVCAMNPCPCGFFTDPKKACTCTPYKVQKYLAKISGPLLDRIDLHVDVPRIDYATMTSSLAAETSETISIRIKQAREKQYVRFGTSLSNTNATMSHRALRRYCPIAPEAGCLLENAMDTLQLSARAYDKIIKIARTIADLDNAEHIRAQHITEAIGYRSLDRSLWGL